MQNSTPISQEERSLLTGIKLKIISKQPLKIAGKTTENNGTNSLSLTQYQGIIEYHPEELVLTVRAGTLLSEIEEVLDKHNQMLLFNSNQQTIGGAFATGGADLRNAVLGVGLIDGYGVEMNFGGQVMKNVAGYDVARLLVGSQGKLALITQISFKVLPKTQQKFSLPVHNPATKTTKMDKLNQGLKEIFDPFKVFV